MSMNIEIKNSENGYYVSVDGHRINDFTEKPPKKDTVIKLICPLISQKVDIEQMFADGILEYVHSPYLSDIFVFNNDVEYFLLAILKHEIKEENNAT